MLSVPVPDGMQQLGSPPSQPFGQLAVQPLLSVPWPPGHPPKQRKMAFRSCLQTAFFPKQQFCDALYPQMSPGGLQLPPFVQMRSVASQVTAWDGGTRLFTLQQASSELPQ